VHLELRGFTVFIKCDLPLFLNKLSTFYRALDFWLVSKVPTGARFLKFLDSKTLFEICGTPRVCSLQGSEILLVPRFPKFCSFYDFEIFPFLRFLYSEISLILRF
jgi:hypothetical protein